jgi:hypothetical protein
MFINEKKLNEGFGKNNLLKSNSLKFCEGENPKNKMVRGRKSIWQKTESTALVNQNWEKLRE